MGSTEANANCREDVADSLVDLGFLELSNKMKQLRSPYKAEKNEPEGELAQDA